MAIYRMNTNILDTLLNHIKEYFDNVQNTHIQERDIYIFACYAQKQIGNLRDTAEYINEKYSSQI